MVAHRVAVVGVSGYSGVELARLIDVDPHLSLVAALSDRWKGEELGRHVRVASSAKLAVRPMSDAIEASREAEIALLATPAEVSAKLAPDLVARGVRVVDLSGAFRLEDPAEYPRWYRFEHPARELLAKA